MPRAVGSVVPLGAQAYDINDVLMRHVHAEKFDPEAMRVQLAACPISLTGALPSPALVDLWVFFGRCSLRPEFSALREKVDPATQVDGGTGIVSRLQQFLPLILQSILQRDKWCFLQSLSQWNEIPEKMIVRVIALHVIEFTWKPASKDLEYLALADDVENAVGLEILHERLLRHLKKTMETIPDAEETLLEGVQVELESLIQKFVSDTTSSHH